MLRRPSRMAKPRPVSSPRLVSGESWATCRLARAICGDLVNGPHTRYGMQTGVIPGEQGIP